MITIAIFADVHGRVALCFDLCARWQQENQQSIDLILQCGDLGAYPDVTRIDKATRKFAAKDPTELGFSQHFVAYDPKVAAVLNEVDANLVFVRGNHEDHDWLDRLESAARQAIFPVDAYQRVWCLRTGMPYTFQKDGEELVIVGIGRIEPGSRKRVDQGAFIQEYEVRQLSRYDQRKVDILITHDVARDYIETGKGMVEVRRYLDSHTPAYHCFGHIGGAAFEDIDDNENTKVLKLADLEWTRSGEVAPGSMAILHWNSPDDHSLEIIQPDWWSAFNKWTWRFS